MVVSGLGRGLDVDSKTHSRGAFSPSLLDFTGTLAAHAGRPRLLESI